MDFSTYPLSGRYYGGSEKKIGILIDGFPYMLKFQKFTAFGPRNNHICEYLGSHIFSLLGFVVQDTYLGLYQGEQVVACKDFISLGEQFVPFNDVGESSLEQDKDKYQYSYTDIMHMLEENKKITNVNETINQFWKIYIVDALIGNFDRHGANWGFMKKNNKYYLAPVFDNGSSLFPNLVDELEMQHIISSKEETEKRVFSFPSSQILLNGKKSSYYEVISSLSFHECNVALMEVVSKINLDKIRSLLDTTPFISQIHKQFLIHMIEARYKYIILNPYNFLSRKGL